MNDTGAPTGYCNVNEFAQAMQTRLVGARETQEHHLLRGNIAAAINWGSEVENVKSLILREADRLEWFALLNYGSLAGQSCLAHASRLREMAS